jgi:protein-disulfide isomerase
MTRKARAARPTSALPPAPPPPRRALAAALVVSLAGVGVALFLVRLHAQAHAGIASFCAISETVNCDKVATSTYSVFLGVPVAAWGALGYALTAALAAWGLTARRLHPGWPGGLLALLGAVAVAVAVALGLVSKLLIGAWCLMCVASWTLSLALLASAWAACRPAGVAAALRRDLAELGRAPGATGLAALVGLVLAVVLMVAFPRYWEGSRAALLAAAATGAGAPGSPAAVVPRLDPAQGAIVYSDYECPFCAMAHAALKAALAERPDIRVLKRHFPLDQACNPAIKRPMHPEACRLAKAAICAEAQGKFAAMDDALFANQQAKKPVETLAAELGLDVAAFGTCLTSQATEQRLAADVAAGLADQVKATPTYVAGGVQYSGRLPVELFAPAPSAPALARPAPAPGPAR